MSRINRYTWKGKFRKDNQNKAANTIAAAWRRKKRRQQSLLQRTALANRRLIKKVAGDREVQEKNDSPAIAPDFESGQGNLTQLKVNNHGLIIPATGTPVANFACNLIEISAGTGDDEFKAREIIMKSISVKCLVENDNVTPLATTHFYLIHDSQPEAPPLALLDDILLRPGITGTGYVPPPHGLLMSFTNKNNVGKDKRIQILDHKWVSVSTEAYKTQAVSVPAISTAAAGTAPNIYGNVTRPLYVDNAVNSIGRGGPPSAVCTLYSQSPYKFRFEEAGASVTPVNQTLYLYAYTYGANYVPGPGAQPQSPIWYRANIRFIDP